MSTIFLSLLTAKLIWSCVFLLIMLQRLRLVNKAVKTPRSPKQLLTKSVFRGTPYALASNPSFLNCKIAVGLLPPAFS